MKAVRSCVTPLSFYQTAPRHAPEDSTGRVYTPGGWISSEQQGKGGGGAVIASTLLEGG